MMMVIPIRFGRVIARAQLENMCKSWHEEKHDFQEKFLRYSNPEEEGYDEQKFDLYQLDDEDESEEAHEQFVLYEFSCK